MTNVFIEATNGPQNWGKFMVARFDEEWKRTSAVLAKDIVPEMERAAERLGIKKLPPLPPMLSGLGWAGTEIIVFDLQTCEGAAFSAWPGGLASSDLNKHRIWVCPLFEPFLPVALPARLDRPE